MGEGWFSHLTAAGVVAVGASWWREENELSVQFLFVSMLVNFGVWSLDVWCLINNLISSRQVEVGENWDAQQ